MLMGGTSAGLVATRAPRAEERRLLAGVDRLLLSRLGSALGTRELGARLEAGVERLLLSRDGSTYPLGLGVAMLKT
jgi:hypothetical protein